MNITRLTFQSCLTLHGLCVQPLCTRMFTMALVQKQIQCKTAATDLSTSVMMLCVYRQWWRKLNPKGFHCVYVLCPVLSTRTGSLTNVHFPLYFTLFTSVEDVFEYEGFWCRLIKFNCSPFAVVYLIGLIFILFFFSLTLKSKYSHISKCTSVS